MEGDAWFYEGGRPGPGWHIHGWRPKTFIVLTARGLAARVVFRRRWLLYGTNRTLQDRSPDEVGGLHVVTMVLLLKLWEWLSSDNGLLRRGTVPALEGHGCDRTMLRWLKEALEWAPALQRAVVQALIERCEPRPVEQLFPGGLSPPDSLLRRRSWLDPVRTSILWQGLAWLFGAAIKLDVSTTALLAEVRRRTPDLTFTS